MVKRILQYVYSTINDGIIFNPGPIELVCYVDASHNCYEDAKGHFGYSFSLGNLDGAFYVKSQKMKLNTLSSTESEYVALCAAVCEIKWLRRLLAELGFPQKKPTVIYEDNMSCIEFVNGKLNHKATKHINPKYHFSREAVLMGDVKLEYCETSEMIADILTKPLSSKQHVKLAKLILNN
jgi:hypothetical protein